MTKREMGLVHSYKYGAKNLYEKYKCPSSLKTRAYFSIVSQLSEAERKTVRVWGNCQTFSVGYIKENCLIVESPSKHHEIKLWDKQTI